MGLTADEMRQIYLRTVIVKSPTYGIVSGYHELPYVCFGASFENERKITRVTGKVQVSPQFIIKPEHYNPSYGDLFGEDNVDVELTGRMFGFIGFRGRPVECKSEHIELRHLDTSIDRALQDTLDELELQEDVTTGVFITPNSRYFPISIERFISGILDQEFRE